MGKITMQGVRFVPFESTGMVSTKGKTYVYPGTVNGTAQPKIKRDTTTGITSRKFSYSTKVTDALEWLKIARADDDEIRESLRYLHNEGNRALGTDGYRIHAVQVKNFAPSDTLIPNELRKRKKDPVKSPNLTPIIPTSHNTTVEISRYDFTRALAACATFAKESSNIVRLDIHETHMNVCAMSAETGDCNVRIEQGAGFGGVNLYAEDNAYYKMTGDPIEIAFNYKYLQDALKGMPEIFSMGFTSLQSPVLIWGDVNNVRHEAVIMPMHIGR